MNCGRRNTWTVSPLLSGRGQSVSRLSRALGLLLLQARIHYLLGTALHASGNASESSAQFKSALSLLERIQKEPGAEHISDRDDLKPMFATATQVAQKN